ncbi:MAG TPA: hypothetical protein DCZ23_02640, partial [Lachnospiraceae bacterium]|nr:hypothetical protein [Lachnospiraceae bacterium]
MKKYQILNKLLIAALLIQNTASYATAAITGNTDINNTTSSSIATTGSAITDSMEALQPELKNLETKLESATLPKKTLRKAGKTDSIYDDKTYTHADA